MREYKRVAKELREYLNKKEVICDKEFINAYLLREILGKRVKTLGEIVNSSLIFVDFKKIYCHEKSIIKTIYFLDDNVWNIRFIFDTYEKKVRQVRMKTVYCDRETGNIDGDDKDFVLKYYDVLLDLFAVVEKNYVAYNLNGQMISTLLSDEMFEIMFNYNGSSFLEFTLRLKPNSSMRHTFSHYWLLYFRLEYIIRKNSAFLLKRFPVAISKLDKNTKSIVEDYFSKKERIKKKSK